MTPSLAQSIVQIYDRFIHYSIAGLIGTLAHWSLFYLLTEHKNSNVMLSSVSGFLCGALVNYTLNYYLTFRSDKQHLKAALFFFSIALFLLGINMILMYLLINNTPMPSMTCQIVTSAAILPIGYMLNKYLTF